MRRHILDNPLSYYAIFHLARHLPVRVCHWLGKVVVLVVYAFSRNDRKGLSFNLSIALNRSQDDPVIRKTVRQIFLNYGQYMADFFLIPQLPSHKVKTFFATIEGEDVLQKALANGRGAILLLAHLGNWEIGGSMLRAMNYPIAVVAMAHNTTATDILVNRVRYDKGIKVFHVDRSLFSSIDILRYLRNNGIVAISGDKDFYNNGRPVTYFGKTVSFPLGPVVMAMNSGADLIPAFVLKQPDGKYFGVLEEAIPLDLEGDRYEIIDKNLAKTARIFERYIRAYPDQWYCPDPIVDN
ncbi:MAG: lysophospholipid acyltransferase family protein [Desulfobacterales bacterium]|nr:MAG: lysophospholipid acyltransferase family protein [Desulfobacterales bacterium]